MPRDVHNIKSQIVVDSKFDEVIGSLRDIKLPSFPEIQDYSSNYEKIPCGKVTQIEPAQCYNLDYQHGIAIINDENAAICAYDESIATYEALEGHAVCVSHALVYVCPEDYLPITYLTLRFFTKSELVKEKMGDSAIVCKDCSHESSICVAKDKMDFLTKYCVDSTILLIDGPLIAGDGYTTFIPYVNHFSEHNILSAFFVKNSTSNMVIDNIPELSKKYNSDMHWCNTVLKPGQRTPFFEYTDINNERNSKVFCYIKFYDNTSPVRLEFPTIIFEKFKSEALAVVDLAYYLLLVQGDKKNPQLRPIAIAEKYARETIKVIDVNREMHKVNGLTKTMNENRWGNL